MSDFFPTEKDARATYARTLEGAVDEVSSALGLTTTEVSDVKDNCKKVYTGVEDGDKAEKTFKQAITAGNKQMNDGVKGIRAFAKMVKANSKYTEEIGKALGIIGPHSDFDPDTYKAELSATVFPGHVTLKFVKKGVDGVYIYSRLAGETKWVKLSFDSHSPYIDNRPLQTEGVPETREYMCMGVLHDVEIGHQSDVVSVVFGG